MSKDTSDAGNCPAKYLKLREKIEHHINLRTTGLKRSLARYLKDKEPELWRAVSYTGVRSDGQRRGTGFSLSELYIQLGLPTSGTCRTCGGVTSINEKHGGVLTFCSAKCLSNDPVVRAKHSVPYSLRFEASRIASIKEKREASCLKSTGFKYALQNPEICKAAISKGQHTHKRNTGYCHPSHNPATLEKIQRGQRRLKTFVSKDGKKFTCQGYEPRVLAYLDEHPLVEKFQTGKGILPIPYDLDGIPHLYHPDIIVHLKDGRQLIVEVKSLYTLSFSHKDRFVNYRKFFSAEKFSVQKGYSFWLATVYKDRIDWKKSPSQYVLELACSMNLDLIDC